MSASLFDRAKLEAAFIVFSTVFDMKLKNAGVVYDQIATVIPGVSERVEFKWLSEIPIMRRWIGDRVISRFRGESIALTTEWWANGIEVDDDDMNNEAKLGMLSLRIGRLAESASRRIDAEVVGAYIAGFAGTLGATYDGQYLYDTDHTAAGNGIGTAQSNVQTGPLNSANFNGSLTKGMQFTDGEGEPISIEFKRVLAGPQNQLAARTLLSTQYVAAGASNVDEKMASWLITPRITGTHWFLLSNQEIMPVIVGIEQQPTFKAVDDPRSVDKFMRRQNLYGADFKFGWCYGFWQASVGSVG